MGSHSTLSPACPTRPPTGKRVADPAYPARDFGGRDMEGQTPQGGNMADEAAAFEAQAAALRDRFGADFAHPLNGNEFGELSDRAKLAATPNADQQRDRSAQAGRWPVVPRGLAPRAAPGPRRFRANRGFRPRAEPSRAG